MKRVIWTLTTVLLFLCNRSYAQFNTDQSENLVAVEGFFERVSATIRLPSRQENLVEVNLKHEITITAGFLQSRTFKFFDKDFGTVLEGSIEVLEDDEVVSETTISNALDDVKFSFFEPRGVGTFVVDVNFQVVDLLCTNNSIQVIPAGWLTTLISTETENFDLSFSLSTEEDQFSENIEPSIDPETPITTANLQAVNEIVFEVSYSVDEVSFDDLEVGRDIFFNIVDENLSVQSLNSCVNLNEEVEEDDDPRNSIQPYLFPVLGLGVILILIGCLLLLLTPSPPEPGGGFAEYSEDDDDELDNKIRKEEEAERRAALAAGNEGGSDDDVEPPLRDRPRMGDDEGQEVDDYVDLEF